MVHFDADEGRYVRDICCISCHEEVVGRFGLAHPIRMYGASIDCSECEDTFAQFDAMTYQILEETKCTPQSLSQQ